MSMKQILNRLIYKRKQKFFPKEPIHNLGSFAVLDLIDCLRKFILEILS